jgi:hypothetical protein
MAHEAGKGHPRREEKRKYYLQRKAMSSSVAPLRRMWIVTISDWRGDDGAWARCKTIGRVQYRSLSFCIWKHIKLRCTEGASVQTASPSYVGCAMHSDFSDFQKFVEWHRAQAGYGMEGYDVDKDLLVVGNKIYGPDTCVLLPRDLNRFLVQMPPKDLPQGVRICPRDGRYLVEIRNCGKSTFVGRFDDLSKATSAYREKKAELALDWVKRLRNSSSPIDSRVIESLSNWGSRYV